jgi:hypothetical protein
VIFKLRVTALPYKGKRLREVKGLKIKQHVFFNNFIHKKNFSKNFVILRKCFVILRMFKNVAILGGIILGVWALAKYRMAQALQVTVYKIKFSGSLQQPKIILGLDLNNPTPYSSTINKINGKIYANNSLIGIIDQNLNLNVNKETKTAIDINIDIMPVAAITNILKYFTDKNFNLKIEGTLTVDGLPIPINYEY